MASAYVLLKTVHVLLAIVAVGFNATYGILLARAGREPEHMDYALRTVKLLDDRFANPAYVLLLVTGLAMAYVGRLSLGTFWLSASLVLYAVVAIVGLAVYAPTLRRQIAALEARGPASAEFGRLSARGRIVGIALAVPTLTIVVLMVTKPAGF